MTELPTQDLIIHTIDGLRQFRVEIAQTNEEQSRGLAGRKTLAPDRGMLFELATSETKVIKRNITEATQIAVAKTGGVITSAGIILVGTFSALMVLPLTDLFQLGYPGILPESLSASNTTADNSG